MKFERALEHLGLITRAETTEPVTSTSSEFVPKIPSRQDASRDYRALDAVYRSLQILETSTRQLSIDVWRSGVQLTESDIPLWLRRPSFLCNSFGQFTAETVSSLAQRGNAYWKIIRNPSGEIVTLDVLNPLRVGVMMNQNGYREYALDGRKLKASEIMHLRLTHVPGEPLGLSPLEACSGILSGALETQDYASQWTRKSGTPTGILTTDQTLSKAQAKEYKEQANRDLQYQNGIAVMGSGLTYKKLLFTPAELQYLDSQKDAVTKIARMFGIPAKMLLAAVDGSSDTYSNVESENQQFARQTLMTYLSEIEDALTALAPRGQRVRFNLDGLLRADTKTRYEAHQIAINSGFLTVDEVRKIEGLQPMPEPEKNGEKSDEDPQPANK
ncbi:phage portal protein [Arcanobacterium hippocoleae]